MKNAGFSTATRLATYGTLALDRVNYDQLSGLEGNWRTGTVRGKLLDTGWGVEQGFPGLILDPSGQEVEVRIFESLELADQWLWLDAFEGDGYRRVAAMARSLGEDLDVSIYGLNV